MTAHDVTLGARVAYTRVSGTPFFLRPYVALRGVPTFATRATRSCRSRSRHAGDVAQSRCMTAVYFIVGNAWFRP